MTFSQSSQRMSQKGRADAMTEEQLAAAVQKVTDFLLSDMMYKRKIKKEDVVLSALNKSSKQFATIIKRVEDILSNVYGLQIARLPIKDDAFIIVNKHQSRFIEVTSGMEKISDKEMQENLLLTQVLASIFMNKGRMFESHLLTILEITGFMDHKFYGQDERRPKDYVAKLISGTFVKQMYLEVESMQRPEAPQNPPLPEGKNILFQWGYRALLEVNVDKIVEYVLKIHDGKKPAFFPAVHHMELQERQARLQAQLLQS